MSGDFFTVLCVGQGFTDDQWMNVYSFSMLRHWLLTYHSVSSGNSTADAGTPAHSNTALPRFEELAESERKTSQLSPTSATVFFFFFGCFLFSVEPFCLFRHLQQTGCSSASPSPTPTRSRMVRRDLVRSLHTAHMGSTLNTCS